MLGFDYWQRALQSSAANFRAWGDPIAHAIVVDRLPAAGH
jgi:hypothetical protein